MTRPHHLTIPTPPAITTLATTSTGYPIPWITPFKPADQGTPTMTTTSTSQGPTIYCTCRYGVGTPQFGQSCVTRQRRGMRRMLCNTCGGPVTDTEKLFIGAEQRDDEWISHEPPTHLTCAAYAAVACPVLHRNTAKVPLVLATEHILLDTVITGFGPAATPQYGYLPHGARRQPRPLIGHLATFQPEMIRTATLADWLASEAPTLTIS